MVDIKVVLEQRGKRHGNFQKQAELAQAIKHAIFGNWNGMCLSDDKREAIEMIAVKIARICKGDQDYKDHWVDIAGYATLVAETLKDEI